jgi:hydroxymethylbilane synthase
MTIDGLPRAARVGSSSLRRRAQLLARRPDLDVRDVRGNVPTRLAKLDRGDYDALVLARAGLQRLGLDERIAEAIATDVVMPAAGQGALAVEVRAEDDRLASLLEPLDHAPTRLATCAERACLGHLEGGCRAPVGVLGTWADGTLTLRAIVASLRGERVVRGSFSAAARTETEAAAAGVELADRLLSDGAAAIISGLRASARAHGEAGRERS